LPSLVACGAVGVLLTRGLARPRSRSLTVAGLMLVLGALTVDAQRAWVSDYALWSRAIVVEPRSWQSRKNFAAQLALAGRDTEAAWPFLVSFALVRRYPHPIDWSTIERLEELPLEQRIVEGPFALEPHDGCAFARVYLLNMQKSAPELVASLASIYAARGCSAL
jgi:hypothetical protein